MAAIPTASGDPSPLQILKDRLGGDASLLERLPIDKIEMLPFDQGNGSYYLGRKIRVGTMMDEGQDWVLWALFSANLVDGLPLTSFMACSTTTESCKYPSGVKIANMGRPCEVFLPLARCQYHLTALLKAYLIITGVELPRGVKYSVGFITHLTRACRKYQPAGTSRPSPLLQDQASILTQDHPAMVQDPDNGLPSSTTADTTIPALRTPIELTLNAKRIIDQDSPRLSHGPRVSTQPVFHDAEFIQTQSKLDDVEEEVELLKSKISDANTKFNSKKAMIEDQIFTKLPEKRQEKIRIIDKALEKEKLVLNDYLNSIKSQQEEEMGAMHKELEKMVEEQGSLKKEVEKKHGALIKTYAENLWKHAKEVSANKRVKREHQTDDDDCSRN